MWSGKSYRKVLTDFCLLYISKERGERTRSFFPSIWDLAKWSAKWRWRPTCAGCWQPGSPCEEGECSGNARPEVIQETGKLNRVAESLPCKKRKNREREWEREREREKPHLTLLLCWSAETTSWNQVLKMTQLNSENGFVDKCIL